MQKNLKNYITEIEKNPEDVNSPITHSINLIELNKSETAMLYKCHVEQSKTSPIFMRGDSSTGSE